MLKILIKKLLSFLLIAIILLFFSIDPVYAYSSGIKGINDELSMNVENLHFSNVSYKNRSNTSTKAFGLVGKIYNDYDFECFFNTTVTYYNSINNVIAITHNSQIVPAKKYNSYNQMSNLSEIKNGYSANDIAYYKLDVEIISNDKVLNSDNLTNKTGNGEYAITKYNIDMKVNENNTFDMNEQITAYFNVAKHGIFRSLPLKNEINRIDGTVSKNRAKISDIKVNTNFTEYKKNGDYIIKIGSKDSTLIGEQSYSIKYNYNIGKDPNKKYDELYFNLIGTEWDTTISNFTFTITMPKEFDNSKLGFSLGNLGSTENRNIKYTVNGNIITGSCNRVIKSGEALTVRIELPEGYFVGAEDLGMNNFVYLIFIIPIIFFVISFSIWKKYGKDNQAKETLEQYPPNELNSLEIGYLYKGYADSKDVISLLIYLANKGYIRISEIEEKQLFFTKKDFKITKLREYDGDNVNEEIFLKGLFTKKELITENINILKELGSLFKKDDSSDTEDDYREVQLTEVTSKDLKFKFYKTIETILENINIDKNKNKILESNTSKKSSSIKLMLFIAFCVITVPPVIEYSDIGIVALPFVLIFPMIGFNAFLSMVFQKETKFTGIGIGILFSCPIIIVFIALLEDKICLVGYIIGLICIIGMIICLINLPKRTTYGSELLGRIHGFKKFLETTEKNNLENLVMENSQYFYNILPYTYVFDISDKWIKKFKTITLKPPIWYEEKDLFDIPTFRKFMDRTMSTASESMTSTPSSGSSGGDSSGGGSSGGGSGGGGGGSW